MTTKIHRPFTIPCFSIASLIRLSAPCALATTFITCSVVISPLIRIPGIRDKHICFIRSKYSQIRIDLSCLWKSGDRETSAAVRDYNTQKTYDAPAAQPGLY